MRKTFLLMFVAVGLLHLHARAPSAKGEMMFGTPTLLPAPINSPYYDLSPSIRSDGLELWFTSNRLGGMSSWCTWSATRETASEPFRTPQSAPRDWQVAGVHVGGGGAGSSMQLPAEHISPEPQLPQLKKPPQPFPCTPQAAFSV